MLKHNTAWCIIDIVISVNCVTDYRVLVDTWWLAAVRLIGPCALMVQRSGTDTFFNKHFEPVVFFSPVNEPSASKSRTPGRTLKVTLQSFLSLWQKHIEKKIELPSNNFVHKSPFWSLKTKHPSSKLSCNSLKGYNSSCVASLCLSMEDIMFLSVKFQNCHSMWIWKCYQSLYPQNGD